MVQDIKIEQNGQDVKIVDRFKYLGVILDPYLKFDKHVDYIKRKVVGRLRMMSKLRPITNEKTALTLYKTLVIPIIDYYDIIYNCLTKRDSETLQQLQNGACRIILQRNKRTPTSDMHRELKLFRLVDRRHLRTMEFMYKVVNELLPNSICKYFKKVG